jgi:hypothetical protein
LEDKETLLSSKDSIGEAEIVAKRKLEEEENKAVRKARREEIKEKAKNEDLLQTSLVKLCFSLQDELESTKEQNNTLMRLFIEKFGSQ